MILRLLATELFFTVGYFVSSVSVLLNGLFLFQLYIHEYLQKHYLLYGSSGGRSMMGWMNVNGVLGEG